MNSIKCKVNLKLESPGTGDSSCHTHIRSASATFRNGAESDGDSAGSVVNGLDGPSARSVIYEVGICFVTRSAVNVRLRNYLTLRNDGWVFITR